MPFSLVTFKYNKHFSGAAALHMVVIGRGSDTVLIGDPVIKGRGLLFLNSRMAESKGGNIRVVQPCYRPVASAFWLLPLLLTRLCGAHAVLNVSMYLNNDDNRERAVGYA